MIRKMSSVQTWGSSTFINGMWVPACAGWRWEPSSPVTSHTFSGLDGDTDRQYMFKTRFITSSASQVAMPLSFNNDTTASHYPYIVEYSQSDYVRYAVSAEYYLGHAISQCIANYPSMFNTEIYAKSGIERTIIGNGCYFSASTQVNRPCSRWTDTVNNITSMTITAKLNATPTEDVVNGIAVGTIVELWKLAQ